MINDMQKQSKDTYKTVSMSFVFSHAQKLLPKEYSAKRRRNLMMYKRNISSREKSCVACMCMHRHRKRQSNKVEILSLCGTHSHMRSAEIQRRETKLSTRASPTLEDRFLN